MATKIVLEGVHVHLDGEYDFDESYVTNFEMHVIKQLTGMTAGELQKARERRDYDSVIATALLVLMRADKIQTNRRRPWESEEMDALWAAHVGSISSTDEPEVEPGPPSLSGTGDEQKTGPAANGTTSGASSAASSENPASDPSVTGAPV